MLICQEEFDGPWISFPPTIHEFYAHTATIMGTLCPTEWNENKIDFPELNESRGLKSLSEENLEKLHKVETRL